MSATKADEGSPSAPPAAVGPMTSLYPQLGPPPGATAAAPQPTLPLSSASTFAEAGVAPEMKARQVTPEDGAASPPVDEVAAPPPPGLSRTTTESMGVPPGGSSPSGGSTTVPATSGTAPAWPAISAHNGEGAARDAEMLSEADDNKMNFTSSTSSEAPKNHIGSTNQSSTKPTTIIEAQFSLTSPSKPKQQEQAPVDTSKDTSNAHGATTTSSGSSSSAGSSPSNRSMAFHGTLCLNTNDLTDQDGTEDTEALAVFRDAIVSKTTGGGGADAGGAAASVAAASTTHAIAATTSKSDDGNMSTGSSSATAAAAEAEKPPAKPQIDVADTLLKQAQMVQAPRTVPAVEIAAQMMSNPSPPSQTALGQSISQTSQASQTSQTSQASLQSSSSHSQQQQQQHGQATMSAAGLAKRAQQQAVEAHIRAEAAIALAQQASELEAMERNLAVAEQGATSQAQMQAEIQQQQQLHSLMLEGLYPNISRGILASSTGAVASAAASPGTADGHAAVLSSLVESQRIREQLLAAEAEAAAAAGAGGLDGYHQIHPSTAAASLLDPSYYSQLLAASGGGHHPVLASAGVTAPAGPVSLSSLSSHMLQLQQLMAGSGAATPAPSSASAHLPSGGNGDSLQRMVEQEEHELRALQLQLHQQQQQLSLRHHLGSGVGPLGGMGGMGVAVGGFGLGGTSMAALGGAIGAVGGASLPIHHAQQQQLQHPESVSIATTPAAGGAAASTSHNGAPASTSSSIPELKAKGPMKKRLKHAHDLEMLQNGSSAGGSKTMVTAQPKLAGAPMYQYTATLPPPPVPPPGYFPAGQPQQRLLLYSPEDHHWLSDQLCFVRKLIEIFEANEEDVTARSRRGGMKKPIKIGRVGLRCVFCSSVPARQRAKGAVSYPNSIRIVHQAIRNFQRYHLMQCPNMPQSIKDEYKSLKTTRCHSGNASLQYWVTSCHALGMCDTDPDNGIRLRAPPSSDLVQALADEKNADLSAAPSGGTNASAASASAGGVAASTFQSSADPTTLAAQVSGGPSATSVQGPSPAPALCQQVTNESSATFGPSLVLRSSSDEPTAGTKDAMDLGGIPSGDLQTTPYMSLILAQQRPTVYQPADSLGKRRPRPSGFPGMECKHCSSPSRVASPGRYFPLTTTVLANNNNPGGCVYVHLMKCGRCPQDVKVTLQRLAERHTLDGENLDRGWRRRLFSALWDRLHQGRVWDESELAEGEADESAEAQIAEESMEEDDHQAQDGDQARPAKEGGDDVGTAALALSALSGLAGKRKQPDDEEEDDDDL